MDQSTARQAVIDAARTMDRLGLTSGAEGNVSLRFGDGFLITPSAMPYDRLTPDDIVWLDREGVPESLGRKPSSEWRFHRDIFRARADVSAVIHTHSLHATALACLRRDVPPFHYLVAVAGGKTIRCCDYARFGTQALSDAILAALVDRRACLMANHGMVACGQDLTAALDLAVAVERLCRIYCQTLAVGTPVLLTDAEMDAVFDRFADYQNPNASA